MLTHTYVVSFSVDVKDGPPIVLCANVLPQITGAVFNVAHYYRATWIFFELFLQINWLIVFLKRAVHLQ